MERENDKGSPVVESKCANIIMHCCIGGNSSERLQCDDGKVVSFVHSEGIDNRARAMIEVLVPSVSNKQGGGAAGNLNKTKKINSDGAFSCGVGHFKQVYDVMYLFFLVDAD